MDKDEVYSEQWRCLKRTQQSTSDWMDGGRRRRRQRQQRQQRQQQQQQRAMTTMWMTATKVTPTAMA
jgi:hypothetical protein